MAAVPVHRHRAWFADLLPVNYFDKLHASVLGRMMLTVTPKHSAYTQCTCKAITFTHKPILTHEQEYFRPQTRPFSSTWCTTVTQFTTLPIHESSMHLHILQEGSHKV